MSETLGKRLFTCAVITDTHLNQGETECNSPFEVNKLANGRMRQVVRMLNQGDLAFVVHLGDLLHPVPAIPHLYERAAERFKEQIAELRHPLYLVPGNHDVGDKPIDWGPAAVVTDRFLALWQKHFGRNYQRFDHGPCRFLLLDAQIINSGLEAEAHQRAWLEAELAAPEGQRLFVMIHYPPYLHEPSEPEHYDNLGEPGRGWLLELLETHRVEALFAGHVHNYWYHRHAGTDCYLLPSTAFVRQDYSEMYRVAPGVDLESGRNDADKLGFFLLHVHEHGHLTEVVRTYGQTAEPDSPLPAAVDCVPPVHPRCNRWDRFGFDMRQSWLETIEIPPSGGLDEFDRKRTRNDYPVMALLDMGVPRVRIPARDLLNPNHRQRLEELAALGLRFTLFSFGAPDPALLGAVTAMAHLIDCWELADRYEALPDTTATASDTARAAKIRLYVSKLRAKGEIEGGGEKYHHMINHGFVCDETAQFESLASEPGIDGVIIRVTGNQSPWQIAEQARAACQPAGLRISLHVRMSIGNLGSRQEDESWVSHRAAEALMAAAAFDDVHAYLDAFADIDRGYFVRQGVVDRLFNPRPAFHVIRHLNAALAQARVLGPSPHFPLAILDDQDRQYRLTDNRSDNLVTATSGSAINLATGEILTAAAPSHGLTLLIGTA